MSDDRTKYDRQNAKSVLQYIYTNYGGTKLFEEKGKAVGLFMDFSSAQQLRKEINLLKILDGCGALQELAQASSLGVAEQKKKLNIIRSDLIDNKALDDTTVIAFLQMMTEILNWDYKTFQQDSTPQPQKPEINQEPSELDQQGPSDQQDSPKPKARKRKSRLMPILIILVIAFTAVQFNSQESEPSAASFLESFSQEPSSSVDTSEALSEVSSKEMSVVVPEVIGMDELTACQVLAEENFAFSIQYQYDANLPSGVVITQSPAAGAQWNNESIDLIVCDKSLGMIRVPNVTGMTLPDAKETLEAAGFEISIPVSGNENAVVTSQSPKGDTEAEQGTIINLVYEKPAVSQESTTYEFSQEQPSSTASVSQNTPAEAPAATQETQPVPETQSVSAYISESTKNVIRFVTTGGSVTVSVEFVYPGGEHSARFPLGTFTDGIHEFSPGITIADPEGSYQVYLYDSSGRQIASSSFTN